MQNTGFVNDDTDEKTISSGQEDKCQGITVAEFVLHLVHSVQIDTNLMINYSKILACLYCLILVLV
jgi:hypothetical protein